MRICFICKYPPIEGGVSTVTYWLARGLASQGHDVHVITNACEVEPMYRLQIDDDDAMDYAPRFSGSGGGGVYVYTPARYDRGMAHIPDANPLVTKLAAVATEVIREHSCEVIFAYYFEPYAVAAYLASMWTGKPLIVKHAGSDVDRLLRVPDLATSYKEILRSADAVVAGPRVLLQLQEMGLSESQLEKDIPYVVPADRFCPDAPALPLSALMLSCGAGRVAGTCTFDPSLPTIGVYGKIGSSKGTYDLIAAAARVKAEHPINLIFMIGDAQAEVVAPAVRRAGIEDRVSYLPLLPNWKVPGFVRACTAVCFLERDFPIAIHGPIVPREVLSCGTCLILSAEIVSNQSYRHELRHGHNVLIVKDPKDHAELASVLRTVALDPRGARSVGAEGAKVVRPHADHEQYVRDWQLLFERHRSTHTANRAIPHQPHNGGCPPRAQHFISLLVGVAKDFYPELIQTFQPSLSSAKSLGRALLSAISTTSHIDVARLRDLVRYAMAHLRLTDEYGNSGGFPVADHLGGGTATSRAAGRLRPMRGSSVLIADFAHDVTVFSDTSDYARSLAELTPLPTTLLFSRSVYMMVYELQIDQPTRELVAACDGSRTADEIEALMCERFAESAEDRRESGRRVRLALDWLYREGVIVFGDFAAPHGWIGGLRSHARLADLVSLDVGTL